MNRVLTCVLMWVLPLPAFAAPTNGIIDATDDEANVVGGSPVSDGDWRDAAGVFFTGEGSPRCTAVLIAPNVALTAGHCLGGISRLLLGDTSWVDPDGEFVNVISEIGHPSLDIAALVLARDASVRPRVVASGCVLEKYLSNGADVAIVGYGAIDEYGEQYSTELREAFTTVVDYDCSSRSGCQYTGQELGAGGNGIDSCFGDSGGPLYLLTEHYDYLVGITSRAFYDVSVPCSEGGVYVRPDAILDWVEDVTAVSIPRADCNAPPDPSAKVLHADTGKVGRVKIKANDPDEGNTHTLRLVGNPMFGEAGTDDAEGVAFYRAFDDAFEGMDSFQVEVTDDGVPALSEVITVQVVVSEGGGCLCRATRLTPGHGLWVLALAAVFLRRRPRRRRA